MQLHKVMATNYYYKWEKGTELKVKRKLIKKRKQYGVQR